MRRVRMTMAATFAMAVMAAVALVNVAPTSANAVVKNKVIAHQLAVELGQAKAFPHEQWVSGGVMDGFYQAAGIYDARLAALRNAPAHQVGGVRTSPTQGTLGCHNVYGPGPGHSGVSNTRANQDCGLRRQAEEVVAVNPTNPQNLIAGQNDSRVGYNQCGYDYSFDGGATWGDQLPVYTQVTFPNGHNLDFCSDPGATFDARGNAYNVGIILSLDGLDSAVVVSKSDAPIGGAFWHSTAPDPFQEYRDVPLGIVAMDENENIANDKELIVADQSNKSPKRNNVYVTWTRFNSNGGVGPDSPIYFSQSTDGGNTWSPGIEISGANASFCTVGSGEQNPNACDQDQGSDPIVGKDGTVYVGFGNGNVPGAGMGQHMVVSCPPTKDCSQVASWTDPQKAGDDFGLQPVSSGTDQTSGCPSGRQCLPPNGYRMDDFVEGSISVTNTGTLFFVWADGRNIGENCQGSYQNATPPCNNDVFYSYSMNGGKTWSATFNLTGDPTRFGDAAQWMPWSAVTPDGQTLWVAFYDRHHRVCETTGCNDITLLKVTDAATPAPTIVPQRLTTASMPNLIIANNPVQAGFLGDYMWVAVSGNDSAPYVVWADTRGLGGAVEEDIYFAR